MNRIKTLIVVSFCFREICRWTCFVQIFDSSTVCIFRHIFRKIYTGARNVKSNYQENDCGRCLTEAFLYVVIPTVIIKKIPIVSSTIFFFIYGKSMPNNNIVTWYYRIDYRLMHDIY